MNTFEKYSKKIPDFLKSIQSTNPDYIVPVERKGCKLLRLLTRDNHEFVSKVRYKQFFDNTKVDLIGAKIAVIDDASKYTSTLYEYRIFFEEKGASVDTYSFVGQALLQNAKREQYDKYAHIFQYLEESTYQEYIIQQSIELSKDEHSFDIDHFVFRVELPKEKIREFISCIGRLGSIDFSNDIYTPDHINKFFLYDFKFNVKFPLSSSTGIYLSPILKIRFSYNENTERLSIVPLCFVTWDTRDPSLMYDQLSHIPFVLPYELCSTLNLEGLYMNILYVCNMSLLKMFLPHIESFVYPKELKLDDYDIQAYIGYDRSKQLRDSLYNYLITDDYCSNYIALSSSKGMFSLSNVPVFSSVMSIMQELRYEYERLIEHSGTILNTKYYLSYEQIFERYVGLANLMKWIDILCDRGVLVARNRLENGVYFRACRSGEGDYDHAEKKTSVLLPMIINQCGKRDNQVHRIKATYLNKILANLAYDYPKNEDSNDFHVFFTKPYLYGPLTYASTDLLDEMEIPLYHIDRISRYCAYDNAQKCFIAVNQEEIKEIDTCFSQSDNVSISEIIAYVDFLKEIRDRYNKDDVLNQLIICRDQDIYYRHVHFDIALAYINIKKAYQSLVPVSSEKRLRDAAKVANEALKKLNYKGDVLYSEIGSSMRMDIRFRQAYKKVFDSIVPFSDKFIKFIPELKRIALLEQSIVNLMLYRNIPDVKYLAKAVKIIVQENFGRNLECFEEIEQAFYENDFDRIFDNLNIDFDKTITYLFRELSDRFKTLPQPKESDYVLINRRREKISSINRCVNFIQLKHYSNFAILHLDFSGFRNLSGDEDVNVPQRVKNMISQILDQNGCGRLAYGATGTEPICMIIFENVNSAVQFSLQLKEFFSKPPLNQIDFCFGCCYKSKICMIENDINEAWEAAKNACALISLQQSLYMGFVIDMSTYNALSDNERASFDQIPISAVSKGDDIYYMNTQFVPSELHDSIIYDSDTDDTIRIGIVTALPEEYIAVQAMLLNPKNIVFPAPKHGRRETGRTYCIGYVNALDGKRHAVALTQLLSAGNNSAVSRANCLLERFPNIQTIIMTGIAGGIPFPQDKDKHVRLGDIVIAREITSYDFVKEKTHSVELVSSSGKPSARLIEAQQRIDQAAILGQRPWEKYIKDCIDKMPKVFQRPSDETDILYDYSGNVIQHPVDESRNTYPRVYKEKIASANRVLKNPKKRDQLRQEYNVYAVEMEASGIADVSWEAEIGYYVVRGISDYCDGHKNDIWHNYAALAAASYTRALIEKMPS